MIIYLHIASKLKQVWDWKDRGHRFCGDERTNGDVVWWVRTTEGREQEEIFGNCAYLRSQMK